MEKNSKEKGVAVIIMKLNLNPNWTWILTAFTSFQSRFPKSYRIYIFSKEDIRKLFRTLYQMCQL